MIGQDPAFGLNASGMVVTNGLNPNHVAPPPPIADPFKVFVQGVGASTDTGVSVGAAPVDSIDVASITDTGQQSS